jgi:NADH:ubiquinone oxidoreductase subunit 6 (subunit J)
MTNRIIFNGREYASTEAMPQAVRTAYQEARAKLEDVDRNGVPGPPRAHHDQNFPRSLDRTDPALAPVLLVVLAVITGAAIVVGGWMIWQLDADLRSQGGGFYVGRGRLALVVLTGIAGISIAIWMMLKKHGSPPTIAAEGSAPDAQTTPSQLHRNEGFLRALDTTEHTLARVLQILLGVAAGGVIAAGVWMISHMDASSRSQAGGIFVGIGVLVALGCIAGIYISMEMRLKRSRAGRG